jgi:16S rRNA G1207 methylase RsmC
MRAAYSWRQRKQEAERMLHAQASTVRREHCVSYVVAEKRHGEQQFTRAVRAAVHEKGVQGAQQALNLHVSLHLS